MKRNDRLEALLGACRRTGERMRDLPLYNAALAVEAIGFTAQHGHRTGVLIAPWMMNLVVLPDAAEDWSGQAPGERVTRTFPGGAYEFMVSEQAGAGRYLSAALFTTVQDFPDQATARQVAAEVLERLFRDRQECGAPEPVTGLERKGFNRPLSRRAFLRGRRIAAG
jgi:[NiFe] hydrogenase assembly HybE family chaperone